MKQLLTILSLLTGSLIFGQSASALRENNAPAPAFMSFAEKMKQVPDNNSSKKLLSTGIDVVLNPAKMQSGQDHNLEYSHPAYVYPHQASFEANPGGNAYDGSTLHVVLQEKQKRPACLIELVIRVPQGGKRTEEFTIVNGKNTQVVKMDIDGTGFAFKRLVFAVTLTPNMNKINIYSKNKWWNFHTCQISYLK